MQLTTNVLGSFILKNGRLIMKKPFPQDAAQVAKRIRKTEDGFCEEEGELIRELIKTGNKKLQVTNPSRFNGSGFDISFAEEEARVPVYWVASELQLDRTEVDALIKKVNRILVRERLKEIDRDQVLMQAVDSLDDADEAINRLVERLREWYSLHFPELDSLVQTHEMYNRLVQDAGDRRNFKTAKLGLETGFKEKIVQAADDSLGVDFTEDDIQGVKALCQAITKLYSTKKDIEAYIEKLMAEVAPNVNALAGPLLGARLISLAHGQKRLATLPAGTIQILGAEDAFFRFLKTGKKPPKHGIIFQLPAIRGAARNVRGKISRTFAAKVAIASRVDAYGGAYMGDKLKNDMEKRIKSLS